MNHIEQIDIANQSEYIVIKEAAEQIEKAYEPDKAVHTILSLISRQMGLNRGRVLLQENTSGFLYTAYAYGLTKQEIAQGRFAISEGISGKVMHSGSPIIVSDIDKEDDYLFRTVERSTLPQETVAFIALPIIRNGVTVGVLAVNRLSKRPRSLDRDLSVLKLMSLFISEILAVNAMIEQQTQYLKEENEQLRAMALGQGSQYGIIGESAALRSALNKVSRATNTAVTVMLKGESGTGKERFSRMLHLASHRQDGPFIAINCAAIPPDLLESELFGHEKGAFTGATQTKQGKIELANNGTLFLDEIGDLDFGLQAKLLRVLEERCVTRVGGTKQIHVDTRIIVASHKDLHEAVNGGRFRLDLFYRLNVFPIELPPLRERDGDIRLLARHFLNQANQEYHTSTIFDKGTMTFLEAYEWPGNIRQLENVVKRAVLMADKGRLITAKLIEKIIQEESAIIHGGHVKPLENELNPPPTVESWPTQPDPNRASAASGYPPPQNNPQVWPNSQQTPDGKRAYWPVSEDESAQLKQALEMARGNKTRAALLLNMTPRQFSYRMKKLDL
ncbi:sigma-54-dependent Fis family transcriptional regulator [Hydrogenovibrio sp. SC-1]|uniref:sigma-54 interaction domain-containing protein n=1 Tax=Hydrogenovibrio sp. SC-1 TaxID=2065820 RepID=UPI000C79FC72|nr:sigma 54-interacting transcriptional regulator [Hydrogenovibrio sp. SC-1]PLA75363.1 sigma-54-dependent Fis family transcriptional regulator [Hydrogenovibrio sp. SC-1]